MLQAPPSMGFSRKVYCSGLPFPGEYIIFLGIYLEKHKFRLKAGGEGDNRGGDSWMASPTQWACV